MQGCEEKRKILVRQTYEASRLLARPQLSNALSHICAFTPETRSPEITVGYLFLFPVTHIVTGINSRMHFASGHRDWTERKM